MASDLTVGNAKRYVIMARPPIIIIYFFWFLTFVISRNRLVRSPIVFVFFFPPPVIEHGVHENGEILFRVRHRPVRAVVCGVLVVLGLFRIRGLAGRRRGHFDVGGSIKRILAPSDRFVVGTVKYILSKLVRFGEIGVIRSARCIQGVPDVVYKGNDIIAAFVVFHF